METFWNVEEFNAAQDHAEHDAKMYKYYNDLTREPDEMRCLQNDYGIGASGSELSYPSTRNCKSDIKLIFVSL